MKKNKDQLFEGIKDLVNNFNKIIEVQLPELKMEINGLIKSMCTDEHKIENTLDNLLSITMFGKGNDLFIQLIEYYKTVDPEGAAFYWNEYIKQQEEE